MENWQGNEKHSEPLLSVVFFPRSLLSSLQLPVLLFYCSQDLQKRVRIFSGRRAAAWIPAAGSFVVFMSSHVRLYIHDALIRSCEHKVLGKCEGKTDSSQLHVSEKRNMEEWSGGGYGK